MLVVGLAGLFIALEASNVISVMMGALLLEVQVHLQHLFVDYFTKMLPKEQDLSLFLLGQLQQQYGSIY
ncbi:Uncharacterised protein [Fusobacterium necrophorum subsp. necrophorum]|nr:Uncharacterised protein [Fusobacterium necrophorum subsp. necrophorum]